MKQTGMTLSIDLFFCFIFLPLVITFVPVEKWIVNYPVFAITLFVYLYSLYFIIRWFRIPQKVAHRKYLQVVVFSIAILIITYFISKIPYPAHLNTTHADIPGWNITHRAQTVWLLSLVVIGYSLSISLIFELFNQYAIKKELEEDKKNAEIALFKAQLNPHFLFNTLNTLYGLVVCKSDKAEDAFVKFTELMKYAYSRIDASHITIKEEFDYILNYIELQKLRLNRHTQLDFDFELDDESAMIAPMILISFVENAFKYGTSSTKDCKISIKTSLRQGLLTFACSNHIMKHYGNKEDMSVGIANTKGRLERIYPDKHELIISEKEGEFSVILQLKLESI